MQIVRKHYLVAYVWQRPDETSYQYENQLISGEPLAWLLRMKEQPEKYTLLWAQEINAEQFKHHFLKMEP